MCSRCARIRRCSRRCRRVSWRGKPRSHPTAAGWPTRLMNPGKSRSTSGRFPTPTPGTGRSRRRATRDRCGRGMARALPYDISPDGRRFLMIKAASGSQQTTTASLVVVQNWTEELKRLVPPSRSFGPFSWASFETFVSRARRRRNCRALRQDPAQFSRSSSPLSDDPA